MNHARTLPCLAVALVAGAGALPAGDWPQFRGPDGQGHAPSSSLPLRWGPRENVAWKLQVPGKGWSSPIVRDGRIYLTSAVPASGGGDGGPQSLRALALDEETGRAMWDVEVFRQSPARIHSKNSHASATPLTDGKRLFVHYGTHGTACLDLEGNIVWRNSELRYEPVHGNGGSPVLSGEALIVNCDGGDVQFVAALDRRTGRIRWKTERPPIEGKGFSFSTPLAIEVNGATQVVSAGPGAVATYDPASGREVWRVRYGDGYSVVPRPVHGHGLVFISTGYDRPSILAIRTGGTGDITRSHVAWRTSRGAPHNPSPLVVASELYMVSDRGIASCLDARTGKLHWQERLGGDFSASPLYADGKVWLLSEDGECVVIEAGTRYREVARNSLGERTLASPAVSGGALYIRTERHLYRIAAQGGRPRGAPGE